MKKYVKPGAYVPGLPARDLSDEEWDEATPDQKAKAAGLYEDAPDEPQDKQEDASESQPAS